MSKKLYKIENGIGVYWVVANDPTEAETKLVDVLDRYDYGFSSQRKADVITVMAEEVKEYISKKELEAELAVTKESIKNLFDQIQEYEPHFHYIISQWDEYINLKNNL